MLVKHKYPGKWPIAKMAKIMRTNILISVEEILMCNIKELNIYYFVMTNAAVLKIGQRSKGLVPTNISYQKEYSCKKWKLWHSLYNSVKNTSNQVIYICYEHEVRVLSRRIWGNKIQFTDWLNRVSLELAIIGGICFSQTHFV